MILRVDGVASLVHMTPVRLELLRQAVKKRVKNALPTENPPGLSEMEGILQNAKIRQDWNTANWKESPPHGWAWREEIPARRKTEKPRSEIVALVYKIQSHPGTHEIFLDSEIVAHSRGALALIRNMTKRHDALMAWNKKQHEKSPKKQTRKA